MRKVDPARHEAKRRQIVEAAVVCFARKGFHQTSTAEICATAGMSPGNLFHYFENKNAIIAAIAEEDRKETAQIFDQLGKAEDLVDGLVQLANALAIQAADPIYAGISLEVAAEAARNAEVAALFVSNDLETRARLTTLLREAAARGQVDGSLDLEQAATWLIIIFEGVVGRAGIDASFNPKAHAPTLRLLIERFLRPQSR